MASDFDPNKIFSDILQGFERTGNIVNDVYIKKILNAWKIKDFRYDENENVANEFAINELQKITEKIILSIPLNVMYTIIEINKIEIDNALKDEFCSNVLFICMFCFGIHRYFAKKLNKPTNEELVFSNLTATMLENVKGVIFSYMSSDSLTVIQKIRIVYECYVIFLFINKHKELVKPFLDYTKIIEYKIFRDMPDYETEEIHKLKENYENEFYENLGWTKSIIKEKNNRNLAYLAQDVGLDEQMSVMYKLSSNYIHTNAYSAFMKNAINQNYVRIYLPFVADITIRQINMFIKVANKINHQNEMLSVLLNRLENILFPESIFEIKEKDEP